jgi:two-component system, NtrC family, sensor histidine kinase HydH
VLVPATIVVAADHFIRQQLWPESVFGIINPEWWRFLEHAFWVVFEDIVLIMSCIVATREMRQIANVRAEVEALSVSERNKSQALDGAMAELRASQEARVRTEKLAAVGQLAASVGHELRNPLAAVRSALAYVGKRVGEKSDAIGDAKVAQFLTLADRELQASFKIISDLLDFARERPPSLSPCPLHPLVEEVLTLVPKSSVRVVNEVPIDLPVPSLDKDQCRQLLANLVQNAMEAIPSGQAGEVIIRAEGGADRPLRINVRDNGPGMEQAIIDKIFEPLFTTKSKGTGLGLAIVASVVRRHGGTIRVDSAPGQGSTFIIELPQVVRQQAA